MIPENIQLETPRLILRKFSRDDIPFVFSASRYAGFNDGMRWEPPESEEDLIAPCEANEKAWHAGTAFTFTVETKSPSEPVGRISVRREAEEDLWDIGFWTHPEHQSQGYMSFNKNWDDPNDLYLGSIQIQPWHRKGGLIMALLTKALDVVKDREFATVTVGVHKANTQAISLYRKFGFVFKQSPVQQATLRGTAPRAVVENSRGVTLLRAWQERSKGK